MADGTPISNPRRQSSSLSKSQTKTLAAFQLVKCNVCQIELTRKDLAKHTDSICKTFIENHYHLSGDKIDNETLSRTSLFENPFLLGPNILFTPNVCSIGKDKLPETKANESVIFLSPELMIRTKLNDGSYVSIQDINDDISRGYFRVHRASPSDLKSCLSVGFLKDNIPNKRNPILRIELNVVTTELKSIQISILREFSDPLIYLNVCSNVKKHLTNKLIVPHEKFISVIVNNIEYELEINGMVAGNGGHDQDELQKKFSNLWTGSRQNGNQEIDKAHIITDQTVIIFPPIKHYVPTTRFVGYEKQIKLLRSIIVKPLINESTENLPKNILLTGPTGTGKTLAIRTLLSELYGQMNIVIVPSALLISKTLEFEKLNQFFRNLVKLKPSLLFLDNLEDISNEKNQLEKRIVAWLKVFFDDLPKSDHIIVVGATNRADLLDNTLRRPGRFDIEIDFPVPTAQDRILILKELLNNNFRHELTSEQIEELARTAHGYTGVDLESLCRTYLLNHQDGPKSNVIRFDGMAELLAKTKPSTMREIVLETPQVRWSDIGGLDQLKRRLEECVVWPIKQPEMFVQMGIDPPKGVLMYGPPGCCKTMIGKALAHESGLNFFSIKGPELFSKWVGESERAVREIFRRARAASPSILFFDEIDALATERGQTQSAVGDRVLAQLLTEIDGIENLSKVIIIAATNRPDIVDKALLRPGRLDSVVYVSLPNFETRKEILRIRLEKMPLDETIIAIKEYFLEVLSKRSEGYSGAEINAICQRAALLALADNVRLLSDDHFYRSLDMVKPQTAPETIEFFERFASKYNNVMV